MQWMAPEVLRDDDIELAEGFDDAVDVYSFAMVMFEVAHNGKIPWEGKGFTWRCRSAFGSRSSCFDS